MRRITRPNSVSPIAAVDGGPVYDERLPERDLHGPFSSTQDFHCYLRANGISDANPHPEVAKLIELNKEINDEVRFTHSDLSSLNVLAYGDKVTGIVDWATAGWLPQYWEYTSAWRVNPQNIFWQDEVDEFLQPFPRELEMDKLRRAWFGDF